jgi:hypothetical protein
MRSGSTWLHRNLRAHPSLWLPPVKELHYFDFQMREPRLNRFSKAHLKRRLRSYRHPRAWRPELLRWDLHYFLRNRGHDWYRSLFRPAPYQIAGEITPRYSILDGGAIRAVSELFPELKLIFVMRNPIERSWSQVAKGALDERGPAARELRIEELVRRLRSQGVRRRSDYPAILRHWTAQFAPSRIFVAFFEEIESSPRTLLERLFDFLGVESPGEDYFRAQRVTGRSNPTPSFPMPGEIHRILAEDYRDLLEELHRRFGGHASAWYREALAVLGAETAPSDGMAGAAGRASTPLL